MAEHPVHTMLTSFVREVNAMDVPRVLLNMSGDASIMAWSLYNRFTDETDRNDLRDALLGLMTRLSYAVRKMTTLYKRELNSKQTLCLMTVCFVLKCMAQYRAGKEEEDKLAEFAEVAGELHEQLKKQHKRFQRDIIIGHLYAYCSPEELAKKTPLDRPTDVQLTSAAVYLFFSDVTQFRFLPDSSDTLPNHVHIATIFQYFEDMRDVHTGDQRLQSPGFVFFLTHLVYLLSCYGLYSLDKIKIALVRTVFTACLDTVSSMDHTKVHPTTHGEMLGELLDCKRILGHRVEITPQQAAILNRAASTKPREGDVYDALHVPYCLMIAVVGEKLKRDQPFHEWDEEEAGAGTTLLEDAELHFDK